MTENFTLKEFCASDKARELNIDNVPNWETLYKIKVTCEGLEKIRALTGKPIHIMSGYRSKTLNEAVGGSKDSRHMKGEAADIVCPEFGSVKEFAQLINDHRIALRIDQVINEQTWVHVSFTEKPRYQALTKTPTGYIIGIS